MIWLEPSVANWGFRPSHAKATIRGQLADHVFLQSKIKVGLELLFRQAMVSTQDERLGVTVYDVQPVEQT